MRKMPAYWRKLFTFLFVTIFGGSLLMLFVILPAFSAYTFLHPTRWEPSRTPAALGMAYEEVQFPGDGIELAAWFIPGPTSRTVVLLHGMHSERSQLLDIAYALHQRGFSLLLCDLRAHGASGGTTTTYGFKEPQDVLGAIAYLKARPDVDSAAIGLMGYSLGAATALLVAARSDDVKGVVADSSFATLQDAFESNRQGLGFLGLLFPLIQTYTHWAGGFQTAQVRPIESVGMVSPRAVLFIHGDEDRVIPLENSVRLYQAAKAPKELWVVPGAGHVEAMKGAPPGYFQKVGDFFDQALADAKQ